MGPSVAIALGANLGRPSHTPLTVRPLLEKVFLAGSTPGGSSSSLPPSPRCRWSPLFQTEPVGGPLHQPPYLNAVLLVDQIPIDPESSEAGGRWRDPLGCLQQLQSLEKRFGRQRQVHWGPRTLDLDLLWWGERRMNTPQLTLPHPRLWERSFVLAPLAAIDASALLPPSADTQAISCGDLLASLLPGLRESPPVRLPARSGWPE